MNFATRCALISWGLSTVLLAGCVSHFGGSQNAVGTYKSSSMPRQVKVRLDANGIVTWNGEEISQEELVERLDEAAHLQSPPAVIVDGIDLKAPRASRTAFAEALNAVSERLNVGVVGGT